MLRADVWWRIPEIAPGSCVLDVGDGGRPILEISNSYETTFVSNDIRRLREARDCGVKTRAITGWARDLFADVVLYSPPQREAKLRVFELLEGASQALSQKGALFLAGQKNRGIESYRRHTEALFGEVAQVGRAGRIRVYRATTSKLGPEVTDPWCAFEARGLDGEILNFVSRSGVFAFDSFDQGSRLLVDTIGPVGQSRILDVGCGCGVIGITLAAESPDASVLMCDASTLAEECALRNAEANGLAGRSEVVLSDLYDELGDERFDLITSNPPFHEGSAVLEPLVERSPQHLAPGGRIVLVCMRPEPYLQALERAYREVQILRADETYSVISGRDPKP